MGAAFIAAAFMGCLGFLVRKTETDASVVAFFRFAIGFVLMSLLLFFDVKVKRERVGFSAMSCLSGAAIGLCILFYFHAIQHTDIGIAAFILYLGPVFAIIGEAILTRRLPGLRDFLIILPAFIGFLLISSFRTGGETASGTGIVLALLAGIFYGGYILANRFIPQAVTLRVRVFWQFLSAGIALGLVLIFRETSFDGVFAGWPYILVIGLVQGFAVLLLTGYAIKHLKAIEYGVISYTEPVIALLLGIVLYGEILSGSQFVGIALIIAAMLLQYLPLSQKTSSK